MKGRNRIIGKGISIIRVNSKRLGLIGSDEKKLRGMGLDISIRVPLIEIVNPNKQTQLQNLLLNYGFMVAPLHYLRDMQILTLIRQNSESVNSFFFRKNLVHNIQEIENPVLVETVSIEKLEEIMLAADSITESYNSDELKEGEYLILSDKPFEGLMVQVLSIRGDKLRVKLMIGPDFTMEISKSFMNYQKVYNVSTHAHSKELLSQLTT